MPSRVLSVCPFLLSLHGALFHEGPLGVDTVDGSIRWTCHTVPAVCVVVCLSLCLHQFMLFDLFLFLAASILSSHLLLCILTSACFVSAVCEFRHLNDCSLFPLFMSRFLVSAPVLCCLRVVMPSTVLPALSLHDSLCMFPVPLVRVRPTSRSVASCTHTPDFLFLLISDIPLRLHHLHPKSKALSLLVQDEPTISPHFRPNREACRARTAGGPCQVV